MKKIIKMFTFVICLLIISCSTLLVACGDEESVKKNIVTNSNNSGSSTTNTSSSNTNNTNVISSQTNTQTENYISSDIAWGIYSDANYKCENSLLSSYNNVKMNVNQQYVDGTSVLNEYKFLKTSDVYALKINEKELDENSNIIDESNGIFFKFNENIYFYNIISQSCGIAYGYDESDLAVSRYAVGGLVTWEKRDVVSGKNLTNGDYIILLAHDYTKDYYNTGLFNSVSLEITISNGLLIKSYKMICDGKESDYDMTINASFNYGSVSSSEIALFVAQAKEHLPA